MSEEGRAQRAEALGLVNQVVPAAELEAKVDAMADELAAGATQYSA